jgi:hypothetical protein
VQPGDQVGHGDVNEARGSQRAGQEIQRGMSA